MEIALIEDGSTVHNFTAVNATTQVQTVRFPNIGQANLTVPAVPTGSHYAIRVRAADDTAISADSALFNITGV